MPNIPFSNGIPISFTDIRGEFDRLLDRVWHVGLNTAPLDGQDWAPSLDVVEHPDHYLLRYEVPGIAAEDLDLSILGRTISIRGVKSGPVSMPEGGRKLRSECRYGSFERRYEFSSPVDSESISATCKNGVLEVTVAKTTEPRGKSVPIEAQS